MTWAYSIDTFEIVLIAIFALLYLLYVIRLLRIRASMRTPISKWLIKFTLRSVYFALMMVALLGPSFGDSTREIKSIGKDMFICVDLSQSMNAFDIQPTRLEKVKFELKNIVEAFSSDRIGLIMFSNEAYMQCPLTYDNNALNLFIQALTTDLVPNSGTDFGPPLKMALKKLTDEENTVARQKSKIIVLISDGEDFGEETEQITEEIESSGIKLFTLGVGTERGSKIMTRRGYKKNNQGEEVVSKINTKSLKKIASDTGGKYFEINDSKNDVDRLINSINDIEGELRDSKQVDTKSNKYFYFLMAALLLMLFDALISVKVIRI
ncbi:vWA domain-containing protein [Marinoscillum luteum]|jgi:Ca-activated chloride channel family protein|uniref:VWA domain-containing protein n=1 Tax=Marinoscillum luteum TaxID=861051 RepID=A0ABW7NCT1_9BACT